MSHYRLFIFDCLVGPIIQDAYVATSDGSSAPSSSSIGRESGGGCGGEAAAQADASSGKQEGDDNEAGAKRRHRVPKRVRPTKEAGCKDKTGTPVKGPKRTLSKVAATITAAGAGQAILAAPP